MGEVTVAAMQMASTDDYDINMATAERVIRAAAAVGAARRDVLLTRVPVHRNGRCVLQTGRGDGWANGMPHAGFSSRVAIVIPTNIFERANNAYFNTNVIIDADGLVRGHYRKSHIPLGLPGCCEKVYSNPGDTGFLAFETAYGTIGTGVCWDQWFPEAARIMPLVCSNRVGLEKGTLGEVTFFGQAFIAGPRGEVVQRAASTSEMFVARTFDLDEMREMRAHLGLFRDRRPDLYRPLLTLDGRTKLPD